MEVIFYPNKKEGKILAFADVMIVDGITVRGFRVVDGTNGIFASVPSRTYMLDGQTRFAQQVTFATQEIRDRFLGELLECFYQWQGSQGGAGNAAGSVAVGAEAPSDSAPPF